MAGNQIKAVLFDFGETLVRFGKPKILKYSSQGARLTYEFLKTHQHPTGFFYYYRLKSVFSILTRVVISNFTGRDFDSLETLKKTGIKNKIQLDEEAWQELVWLWYKPLYDICQTEPDLGGTLEMLKDQGIKLGIVSNTFVHGTCLDRHLEKLGIIDLFDVRLYSYQFRFRKPDQRIFIAGADRIHTHLPNILYVGDRIDKDIEPALGLDMHAAMIAAHTNQGRTVPKSAWKIRKLSQLPEMIKNHNKTAAEQ